MEVFLSDRSNTQNRWHLCTLDSVLYLAQKGSSDLCGCEWQSTCHHTPHLACLQAVPEYESCIRFIDLLYFCNLASVLISLSFQCKLEHEIFLRHLVARSRHGGKAVRHCFSLEKCLRMDLLCWKLSFVWLLTERKFLIHLFWGLMTATRYDDVYSRRWVCFGRRNSVWSLLCICGLFGFFRFLSSMNSQSLPKKALSVVLS